MRIPEQDIQNIRERIDIVDVIGKVVPLEKHGKEYRGICPFHDDHSPSMNVSPEKQIYKCYACGAGGNVFTFLQNYDHITFLEAVKKAAEMIHYPLPEFTSSKEKPVSPLTPLYQTLDQFTAYCQYELTSSDGKEAMAYLQSRKFDEATLSKYQIGFAPDRDMEMQYLKAKFQDLSLCERTGLIQSTGNHAHPVFVDRIMIPIHDPAGHPVGYTARILPGSPQQAKYINTTQTELYEKGRLIFNYHRAVKAARKAGRLILCEGAMDVLGLAKAGLDEGIANLGTACTKEQMNLILQAGVPVVVFYDQDSAGQKAAWNFGQKAMQAGLRFSIVRQSIAKDPDEVFIARGKDGVLEAVSSTISYAEFAFDYLQSQYDLNNYEDKKNYAKAIESLIRTTLESYEQPAMLERLQQLTGFSFDEQPIENNGWQNPRQTDRPWKSKFSKGKRSSRSQAAQMPLPPALKGREQAEKAVCWAMMFSEDYQREFMAGNVFLQNPICSRLSGYLNLAYKTSDELDVVALQSEIKEPEVRDLLIELSEWPDYSDVAPFLFQDAVRKIQKDILNHENERLSRNLSGSDDSSRMLELLEKKKELRIAQGRLRKRKED